MRHYPGDIYGMVIVSHGFHQGRIGAISGRKLPEARPAAVAVTMTDGTVLHASTETNRGDWRDPYSAIELHDKYDSLTARLWDRKSSHAIYIEIMNLDKAGSLTSLENLIKAADQSPPAFDRENNQTKEGSK